MFCGMVNALRKDVVMRRKGDSFDFFLGEKWKQQ